MNTKKTKKQRTEQEQREIDQRYINNLMRLIEGEILHITTGNSKTAIPSWNMLGGAASHPYDGKIPACYKDIFKDVCGTCGVDCDHCYAKNETRNPDTAAHMLVNTIIARKDLNRIKNYINS